MHWSPSLPLTNKFGYQIRVNGFGWIDASLSHAVTSPRFGTIGSGSKSFTRTKVGSFYVILLVPYASAVTEQTVGEKVTASYNNEGYDTYSWTASGTVSLQAVYWKATAGYPFMGGSWENLGSAVPYTYNSPGSWTLTGKLLCPKCSQEVSHFSRHNVTCDACGNTYWNCNAQSLAHHTGTHTCPGCSATIRNCMGSGNGASPHGFHVCTSCVYGYTSGKGVSYKCAGPHSCSGDSSSGSSGSSGSGSGSGSGSSSSSGSSTNTPFARGHPGYGQTWHQWINRDRTCRRCGTTFNRRNNSTCYSRWGTTYPYHWDINAR